jgi:hypothetical protein
LSQSEHRFCRTVDTGDLKSGKEKNYLASVPTLFLRQLLIDPFRNMDPIIIDETNLRSNFDRALVRGNWKNEFFDFCFAVPTNGHQHPTLRVVL